MWIKLTSEDLKKILSQDEINILDNASSTL